MSTIQEDGKRADDAVDFISTTSSLPVAIASVERCHTLSDSSGVRQVNNADGDLPISIPQKGNRVDQLWAWTSLLLDKKNFKVLALLGTSWCD